MRDMNELKNAFGQADEDFVNNVYQTLTSIQSKKDAKPLKKIYFRLVAVITIVCILSAGTILAFTNTWGILDFLSGRKNNIKVLPEASSIVQKFPPQKGNNTNIATFTAREAVYDGQSVYIVLDVKPSSPDFLLLGPDAYPLDEIKNMGPIFSDQTGTIADYARKNNKVMFQTSVVISKANCSISYLLKEDGTLVYMVDGPYDGDSISSDVEFKCVAIPFVTENGKYTLDMDSRKDTTLSVTLKNTGTKKIITSKEPAIYEKCGIRVDKITLKSSAVSTYAEVEFTVLDKEKYAQNDGILFEFLDRYGEVIPIGAASGGGIETIDDTHYIEKISLQAFDKLPKEVILRGHSFFDRNQYDTHTFEMK